jgi:cell division protein FtsQ
LRSAQTIWRVLAVSALAGGMVWIATRPFWVIQNPEQVVVQGNRYLPTPTIRSLLPITYPQSLLKLQPQAIADILKSKAPIAEVSVSRRLFPPGLVLQVQERFPVAITIPTTGNNPGVSNFRNGHLLLSSIKVGLLDERGGWIPIETYTALDKSLELPKLKIIGNLEQYRPYWSSLYQEVSRSPVKIQELNWQNPADLILKTEIGKVHLGSYSPNQFSNQLKTLDRMRKLPSQPNFNQIESIDVRNPDAPILQMFKSEDAVKSSTP